MNTVNIKPELLRWALDRAGLKLEGLTEQFPKLHLWEKGQAMPTFRQLEAFAHKTLTPLGYFFLQAPPEEKLPIPNFRTVRDERVKGPSPNLLETIQIMQRRQTWMREFLIEQGQPSLSFVGSAKLTDKVISVADDIRSKFGITEGWANRQPSWTEALRSLRNVIGEAGILVAINGIVANNTRRALDTNEFRGFVLNDEYAPLIFVNGADAKAAQMFTLAHELGHVWLGREGVFDLRGMQPADDDVEQFCNRVAAEFLVPEQELQGCWQEALHTEEPFQTLARRFKVSPLVAARRALDLGLITKSAFFDFYNDYQEDDRRKTAGKPSGGDFYATQDVRLGRRFAHAVVRAAKEGRLLYRDAYQLTGLYGETFDRYAKALGGQVGE